MLRLEAHVLTGKLPAFPPRRAQIFVERVHVLVGVGEHEARRLRVARRVLSPPLHQRRSRLVLLLGPHNRAVLRKGGHGLDKIPLGQIARRLPLPIDFLPRHLGDFGRAVPLLQLRKQPAAFDRRQLTIVARENELGPAAPRLDQKLARYARIQHRRLVDDDDGALVPNRPAVLEAEQFGMHGRGARKTVGLQILGDAVGRREADDAAPLLVMRVANGGKRKALAGAGAPLDDFEPALGRRVVERRHADPRAEIFPPAREPWPTPARTYDGARRRAPALPANASRSSARTVRVVKRPLASPVSRSCRGSVSSCPSTFA